MSEAQLLTQGQAARRHFALEASWLEPHDARHREYMARAIALAAEAGAGGDVPIGAVVVDSKGQILAEAANRKQRDGDPTAHAEILALRAAGRSRGNWHLNDCILYVTLEPCIMCAGAIVQARLGLLGFGASDPKAGAIASVLKLTESLAANHRPPIMAGLRGEECRQQLQAWFAQRRSAGINPPAAQRPPHE